MCLLHIFNAYFHVQINIIFSSKQYKVEAVAASVTVFHPSGALPRDMHMPSSSNVTSLYSFIYLFTSTRKSSVFLHFLPLCHTRGKFYLLAPFFRPLFCPFSPFHPFSFMFEKLCTVAPGNLPPVVAWLLLGQKKKEHGKYEKIKKL